MNPNDLPPIPPIPPTPPQPGSPSGTNNQQFLGYDANGQPVYGTPAQSASHTKTSTTPAPQLEEEAPKQYVHISRAISPEAEPISEEVKAKHDQSLRHYPWLNLSDGEYIISAVRRHIIGLILPVGVGVFLIGLILSIVINYTYIMNSLGVMDPPDPAMVAVIGLLLAALISVGVYITVWVYRNNRFFLTNESVIQEIQASLFAKHEQTVSLSNIEDASYQQHGILQSLFNYGSIRLSTEGDETTYRFHYVANPKRQIAVLNNAVEAFKNGRPIDQNEES